MKRNRGFSHFLACLALAVFPGCVATNTLELRLRNVTGEPRSVSVRVSLPPSEPEPWFDGFSLDLEPGGEATRSLEGPLGGTLEVDAGEPFAPKQRLLSERLPSVERDAPVPYLIDIDR